MKIGKILAAASSYVVLDSDLDRLSICKMTNGDKYVILHNLGKVIKATGIFSNISFTDVVARAVNERKEGVQFYNIVPIDGDSAYILKIDDSGNFDIAYKVGGVNVEWHTEMVEDLLMNKGVLSYLSMKHLGSLSVAFWMGSIITPEKADVLIDFIDFVNTGLATIEHKIVGIEDGRYCRLRISKQGEALCEYGIDLINIDNDLKFYSLTRDNINIK